MRNIRLGSLLGIPILVNPTWFLLLAYVVSVLGFQVFPDQFEDENVGTYVVLSVGTALFFFFCIILHELAHSAVARLYQIPVKSITLFVFGGVAQITREAKRPLAELLMAAAGPAMSAVLAGIFFFLTWLVGRDADDPLDFTLFWLGITNLALAIFNMIPAFPMDGGRVFRSLLWLITRNQFRATLIAGWTGRLFGWALMALGALTLFGLDFAGTQQWTGVWTVLIGLFLESAARQSLAQNRAINVLNGFSVKELMQPDPPVVLGDAPVGLLARGVLDINPIVCYMVESGGKLAGILSGWQMRQVPEAQWDTTTAAEAMVPSARLHPVGPERRAADVLMEMEDGDLTHLPVVEDGRVLGVIGRDRMIMALRQAGMLRTAGT
jgi:Zn-dependent protease/CBS domain-containing protein